jgi:hypothetical protein
MSTTTNLALNEPAYNSTSPTWDQPLNYNATILDQMFGNTTSVSVNTGGTPTYTNITAPSATAAGSTSQAMRFNLTGALAANQTVLLPQSVAGMWVVTNSTSGAYTVTFGSNNGSNVAAGTTVALPQGYSILVYSDGTNIKKADDGLLTSITTLSLTGNLTVGGTSTFNGTSAFNATATLSGSSSTLAAILQNAAEPVTITATAATGTINFDVLTQSVLYYTTNASANFTINVRGNGSNTFNSITTTGQAVTIAFINTNGSTPYYESAFTVDGTSVTPRWQGGVAPTSGNASSLDVYTYTIVKTGSAAYTVLATLTQFT